MAKKKTASEKLAQIENDFFKGTDLTAACQTKGAKRRNVILTEVERLLTEKHGSTPLAMWLSDMFWLDKNDSHEAEKPTPLLSLRAQQRLNRDERNRLRLILEIVSLCHDVIQYNTFDLKETIGIKNDFMVTNKKLVEWLLSTEYEQLAMYIAFIMRGEAIICYGKMNYLPAQDELAELYSPEYCDLIDEPDSSTIPPRNYVKTIIDMLQYIDRHWKQGRQRRLNPELLILHDEIYGMVPYWYDLKVLKVARFIYDYMDKELRGQLAIADDESHNPFLDENSEEVQRRGAEVMRRFADKVRELRDENFSAGWMTDLSLSFRYVLAHGRRLAYER